MTDTMGIDQYGETYHGLGRYPRKALLERFGLSSAKKMYRDPDARHVGYILRDRWIELYSVREWKS